MKKDVKVLALDFGASSGRAIIGSFDGEKISLKEIHRFTNDPVILLDTMYWDVLRLFHDIKIGLIKAKQEGEIKSLGIDMNCTPKVGQKTTFGGAVFLWLNTQMNLKLKQLKWF